MEQKNANPPRAIDLFCLREAREGNVWRVYVWSRWMLPPYLRDRFDGYGEAQPLSLDFEDLDRRLGRHELVCTQRRSTYGDIQLEAQGEAARIVLQWLSTAFASDVQPLATGLNRARG